MRVFMTGGRGFLGAWIIRHALAAGIEVGVFDLIDDRRLIAALIGAPEAARLSWHGGDIAAPGAVAAAMAGYDSVIHLAGLLTPACAADPVRAAEVNLIGTLRVFEAARRQGIDRIVYTSTAGVFGPDDGRIPYPVSHYGATKLACEGAARAYSADHGLGSIGFRPYIIYGPGRESGATAGPSLAARAAVRGEAYTIGYRGAAGHVYVEDVALAYLAALRRPPDGAHIVTLAGVLADPETVAAEIMRLVPGADIRVAGAALSMPADIEDGSLERLLPGLPVTDLSQGLALTLEGYRRFAL